jgi:hypothetical protein
MFIFVIATVFFLILFICCAALYSFADARKEIYKILNIEDLEKQRPQDLIAIFLKFSSITQRQVFNDFKEVYVTLLHNYIWRTTGVKKAYGEVYFEQLLARTLSLKDFKRQGVAQSDGTPVYENPFSQKWAEEIYALYIAKYGVRDLASLEEQIQLAHKEYSPVFLFKEYTEIRAIIRKIENTDLFKHYCSLAHLLVNIILQKISKFNAQEDEIIRKLDFGSNEVHTAKENMLADKYIDENIRKRLQESFAKAKTLA